MASLRTQSAMRALRTVSAPRLATSLRFNSSVTKSSTVGTLAADPNQPDYSIHPDKASS